MQNEKPLLPDIYRFEYSEGDIKTYTFKTVLGVLYTATFKSSGYIFPNEAPLLQQNVFEFSIVIIEKPEGKLPPADNTIPATVTAIFHHFFITREQVVIYICETAQTYVPVPGCESSINGLNGTEATSFYRLAY